MFFIKKWTLANWLKFCVWIKIYVGSRLIYFCSNLTSDKNVLFKMVMKTRGPFASFCSFHFYCIWSGFKTVLDLSKVRSPNVYHPNEDNVGMCKNV